MKNIHKNILHLEPDRGLINDPNGLVFFQNKYYVFHQWNRFALDHSYKEWGLFTSYDLIHWNHEGSAILPDSFKDKDGVYSGSAVVKDNQLHVFFTGNCRNNGQRHSYQRHAILYKDISFIKQKNSISTPAECTEHFRDPYVSRTANGWQMIVGGQTKDYMGAVAIYNSTDLNDWHYQGIFFTDDALDQMCECPNLAHFDTKDLLIVCPQKRDIEIDKDISSYAGYIVGKQDENKFLPESKIHYLDDGFDFYAPQVFTDKNNRKIMLGWMTRMSEQQEKECPTRKWGYIHCLTIPRELKFIDGKLYQTPLSEYENALDIEREYFSADITFNSSKNFEVFKVEAKDAPLKIELFNSNICVEYDGNEFILKRKNWVNDEYEKRVVKLDTLENISFYCDRSAIEIFINGGEHVMSARYFCFDEERENRFYSDKKIKVNVSQLKL
ncbi:sucrase [Lactobacillus acidophilus]|uniref:glycoside hydrolase family 32 protein n=1 Tax=Lactobacillus acidophilus TaxID=1579 RepID=UPI000F750529|nr:glycoside hydrolase family 32 protein [Lactobacillus acidophilus]AZN76174.1 sucrase [Lactobacillus acidophilus]